VDVIDRFTDVMIANGIDTVCATRISRSVRQEFCGGLVYVAKRSELDKARMVEDIKHNIPQDKIAKKYGISKITVYRMMRKIRGSRT